MKNMKLLNAPWTVEPVSPWELHIIGRNEEEIFMTPIGDALTEQQWKQAYLVSAAPELLEALQMLSDWYHTHMKQEGVYAPLFIKADKAINKALGV